jgi:hypothetical protein
MSCWASSKACGPRLPRCIPRPPGTRRDRSWRWCGQRSPGSRPGPAGPALPFAAHGPARHRRCRLRGAARQWPETGRAAGLRSRPCGRWRVRTRRRPPRPRWPCGGSRGWGRAGPGCGIHPWKCLSVVHQGWQAPVSSRAMESQAVGIRCGRVLTGLQLGLEGLDASANQVGGNVQRPGGANGGQQGIGVGHDGVAAKGQLGPACPAHALRARGQHHAAFLRPARRGHCRVGAVLHDGGQVASCAYSTTSPSHSGARSATCGSAALSTAAPLSSTTSTWVRSTLVIWSCSWMSNSASVFCAVHVGDHAYLQRS